MNILFMICARAGSKGVKGKNTRMFLGKPLVYYTVAAFEAYMLKYHARDQVDLAINTDSELLRKQMEETGVEYISVDRKSCLAGDLVAKKDVIQDTLREVEQRKGVIYDVIVDLDLTSPLRRAEDIHGTIQTLLEDEHADIAYSVAEARRSPFFNMVSRGEDGYYTTVLKSDFVARQQAPVCYDMNASIYAYRRAYLLSSQIYERKALIWIMRDTGILDIDSEDDMKMMEVIAGHLWSDTYGDGAVRKRAESYGNKASETVKGNEIADI